ncbi:MarR family transcriptional regulator [Boseaceae bacterium BT-24-1]|nr:MarR family transcriptional regulator [Boseaceae bacterium BT-24-1]
MAPIRPTLREAGITEQQWRVLRVLIDVASIDVSALASAALLLPPSLTRILRELQARGLIHREVDADDGRRSAVAITPTGRHVVDLTTGTTLALLDRYADAFGVERLKSLLDELALLTETLGPSGSMNPDN